MGEKRFWPSITKHKSKCGESKNFIEISNGTNSLKKKPLIQIKKRLENVESLENRKETKTGMKKGLTAIETNQISETHQTNHQIITPSDYLICSPFGGWGAIL